MNKVHFIPNPGGEELVLLPRSEYEALLERAEAGVSPSAHAVEREIEEARAADQMIPFEIVEAIADGGNPVRELRRWRGLTQAALAKAAGMGPSAVSDIERGARESSAARIRIARALNVPAEMLFD